MAMERVVASDRNDATANRRDFSLSRELGKVERDGLWRRWQRFEVIRVAILLEIAQIARVGAPCRGRARVARVVFGTFGVEGDVGRSADVDGR
jgi:hypothetical protein